MVSLAARDDRASALTGCRLLQMLSGGEAQKQRLKGMHESILQRTMPIEEVGSLS